MLDRSRKLIVTKHAIDRAVEFKIPIKKMILMFWESDEEPVPPGHKPDRKDQITIFRRSGTCVMVVGVIIDKFTGQDAYLLTTIYDQKMNLSSKYL